MKLRSESIENADFSATKERIRRFSVIEARSSSLHEISGESIPSFLRHLYAQ
jgi:hypothetical protein